MSIQNSITTMTQIILMIAISRRKSRNFHTFSDFIKETDKVLDFGCGGGYLLNELNCADKYGVDINPVALEEASKWG